MLCDICARYTLCPVGLRRFLTQLRPSVYLSCRNKVCACSQFSALLQLTSPQVRTRLTPGDNFTIQQDNNLKHKAKYTLELLTKMTLNVAEWPSYSFDLN
jgi:hypothetical protein